MVAVRKLDGGISDGLRYNVFKPEQVLLTKLLVLENVPRTYNDSFKHMNLRFLSIDICHNHLPLPLVPVFTHEWTNTCDGRVKMNVLTQIKVTGVVFKVFENLLMSHK